MFQPPDLTGDMLSFHSLGGGAWELDHVGHVVRDLEAGVRLYTETLNFSLQLRETLLDQMVEVAFVASSEDEDASPSIELLAPLPGNKILEKFLLKRGPGLHHICFRVGSIEAELKRLSEEGIELIDKEPRRGARDMQVAFLHPRSTEGVLIELCSPEQRSSKGI